MVTGQCAHGCYQSEGGNHVRVRCLGDVHTQCVFPHRLCGCVGLEFEGKAKAVMTFSIEFVSVKIADVQCDHEGQLFGRESAADNQYYPQLNGRARTTRKSNEHMVPITLGFFPPDS